MMYFAHIVNGAVFEIMTFPDGMDLAKVFSPEVLANLVPCTPATTVGMSYSQSGFAAPPPQNPLELATSLVNSASYACSVLINQIYTDPTHQAAYQNAASMCGPGAVVPTAAPIAGPFAAMAQVSGMTPQAFATMLVGMMAVSMQLSNALSTLEQSAKVATSAVQLLAELNAFEASISSIVSAINAILPTPVTAPAPITIIGINA